MSTSTLTSINKNISSSSKTVTIGILDEQGGNINTGSVLLYYSSEDTTVIKFLLKVLNNNPSLNASLRWLNIGGK